MRSKVRDLLATVRAWSATSGRQAASAPSPDVLFDILKNSRRRATLAYLRAQGTGTTVALDELATMVAADEQDCPPAALTTAQRKRVYTALRQSHLPKLADAGLIEYDPQQGAITLTAHAKTCDRYLAALAVSAFPWSEFYVGLGALSSALLVGVWLGVYPFTLLPPVAWAGCITAAFTGAALLQQLHRRRGHPHHW